MDVLGFLLAVAALFMVFSSRKALVGLQTRIADLERRLAAAPVVPSVAAPTTAPPPAPAAMPTPPVPPADSTAAASLPPSPPPPPSPPRWATAPAPAAAAARSESLEQTIGTRWVVWVGGLALALGGVFLVTYAVEQGLIGPGVRVTLAALLAAALIAAGEWARRNEQLSGFAGVPSAHVPSILTAAGTTIAYATVYGAYALYGFIGPAAAFVLLGIVAVATLTAALLHGPALAAL